MANNTTTGTQNSAPGRSWAQVAASFHSLQQQPRASAQPAVLKKQVSNANKSVSNLLDNSEQSVNASAVATSTSSEVADHSLVPVSSSSSTDSPPSDTTPPSTPPNEENNVNVVPYKLGEAFANLQLLKDLMVKDNVTYVAIDIEKHFWPLDKDAAVKVYPVIEVGATFWDGGSGANQKLRDGTFHYITKEYERKHNRNIKSGIYNHKGDFMGIKREPSLSTKISVKRIGRELKYWIDDYARDGEVVIVFHGGKSDLVDLGNLGCDISNLNIPDTQLIDRAICWENYGSERQRNLGDLLRSNGYTPSPNIPFHNAGNDAFYTMTVLARQKVQLIPAANEK